MKRLIVITDFYTFEKLLDKNNNEEVEYYEKVLNYTTDEKIISYFEKKYNDYKKCFDIVEIPFNATDYAIIDNNCCFTILIVIEGKIKYLYKEEY